VDPKKQATGQPGSSAGPGSEDELTPNTTADEFLKRLQSDMRRPQPSQDAISAAFQAMQHIAAESSGDAAGMDGLASLPQTGSVTACEVCGHHNRPGNQFCGMCGLPLGGEVGSPVPEHGQPSAIGPANSPVRVDGPHHYHHHFHHHYFSSSPDLSTAGGGSSRADAGLKDTAKLRASGTGQVMSRNEIAVRKVTHDWAAACNTKQLDDLVSIYATDALVLRPNHAAVRGNAAIREFFFAVLDAGLGEVELEPLRVDVMGDVAYEAGRCKMLVPYVVGKRREERGKYLTVLARQSNGEWKIVSDCWSTDLSLAAGVEAEGAKTSLQASMHSKPQVPRKGP